VVVSLFVHFFLATALPFYYTHSCGGVIEADASSVRYRTYMCLLLLPVVVSYLYVFEPLYALTQILSHVT
jgi:hypothetical protein